MRPDGTRTAIPAAAETLELADAEIPALPEPLAPGATRRLPLGTIAGARSGDKGGAANIGVWVRTADQWRWLAHHLTADALRELLPETKELAVTRHLLPKLRAVNFVIEGSSAGSRLQRAIRPPGQGPRRVAARQARRHPGGDSVSIWNTPERQDLRRRCAPSPSARSCRTSTSGSGSANSPGAEPQDGRRRTARCRLPGVGRGEGGDAADVAIIAEELHEAGTPGGVFASLFTVGIAVPHMIGSGIRG